MPTWFVEKSHSPICDYGENICSTLNADCWNTPIRVNPPPASSVIDPDTSTTTSIRERTVIDDQDSSRATRG